MNLRGPNFVSLVAAAALAGSWACAVLAAPAAHAQAAKPAEAADPVVATVNGAAIRRSDVYSFYRALPSQTRQTPFEALYPALLDRLVTTKAMFLAGQKNGLTNDAEVKRRVAQAQERAVEQSYINELIEKSVTDETVQARYDKFVKETPSEQEVKARHILVATEAQAKDVIAQLSKGGDFAALARSLSTDPSAKQNAGDLGFFSRAEMVAPFAEAAFKMKDGETSAVPVRTQFGWHVIQVEAHRELRPSFEEMRDKLTNDMAQEIINGEIAKLRKDAKIQIVSPTAPAAPADPAAAPRR